MIFDLSGLPTVAIFAALFFATFVSEDAACVTAGALAARGELHLAIAITACFLGIVVGDLGLYWAGRLFGRGIASSRFGRRVVSDRSLQRASAWLDERGASAVFVSRFVTGLRLPTYLAAGFLKTNFWRFAIYFVIAAAIWTPVLVGAVAFSGDILGRGAVVAAIATFIAVRFATRLTTYRGRRLAVGKVKRILRWEFWPLPVFYVPVVCYVILLSIRYRSLTIFTCVNPAMPAGGFVGESKDAIYRLIGSSEANRRFLLRHEILRGTPGQRPEQARQFMRSNGLSYPVVVKPDAGERGKGVTIVASDEQLADAIAVQGNDQLIQEFHDGGEVSIFYYRHPDAGRGTIFSMTQKIFPSVTGNGISTLEQLILGDHRAVCLAEKYFEENRSNLGRVPEPGEIVPIIRIGTHSRGAIFVDGGHLLTPAVSESIDWICRSIDGFDFGRFDIRFWSLADFQAGRNFRIIELNGVTSESTNIYDPRYSLIDAYRILFRQWRLAFEIGDANKKRGVHQTPLADLLKLILTRKPQ